MYRQFMSHEEYDRIVAEGLAKEAAGVEQNPHCNSDVIHAPGVCGFCDGRPTRQRVREASGTPFTPAGANGWGGNVAPIIDDEKAAAETAEWERVLEELTSED